MDPSDDNALEKKKEQLHELMRSIGMSIESQEAQDALEADALEAARHPSTQEPPLHTMSGDDIPLPDDLPPDPGQDTGPRRPIRDPLNMSFGTGQFAARPQPPQVQQPPAQAIQSPSQPPAQTPQAPPQVIQTPLANLFEGSPTPVIHEVVPMAAVNQAPGLHSLLQQLEPDQGTTEPPAPPAPPTPPTPPTEPVSQIKPAQEWQPEPAREPQPEPEAESEAESEPEAKGEQPQLQQETELEAEDEQSKPEPEAEPQSEAELPEAKDEQSKPEPEAEPESEAELPEAKDEQSKPEPEAEPESEAELPEAKDEQSKPEPEAEPESEAELPEAKDEQPEPAEEPGTVPEGLATEAAAAESTVEVEPEQAAGDEIASEPKPAIDDQPESTEESEGEPEAGPEAVSETEPVSEAEPEAEPEPEVPSKAEETDAPHTEGEPFEPVATESFEPKSEEPERNAESADRDEYATEGEEKAFTQSDETPDSLPVLPPPPRSLASDVQAMYESGVRKARPAPPKPLGEETVAPTDEPPKMMDEAQRQRIEELLASKAEKPSMPQVKPKTLGEEERQQIKELLASKGLDDVNLQLTPRALPKLVLPPMPQQLAQPESFGGFAPASPPSPPANVQQPDEESAQNARPDSSQSISQPMNVPSHLNAGGIALPPAQGRPSVVSDDEREQLKQLLAAKDAREQADAQRGTQPTDTESSESPESSPTEPSPTEPSESTPLESIESAMQQEPTPPQTQQPTPDASQASSGPSQATPGGAPQEVAAPSSRVADPDSPMAADPNEIAALSASSAPNVPVLPEIDGEEDPRAMLEAMRKATRATSDGLVLKPLNVEEGPLPQRKADASSMKMSKMRQLDMGAGSMAMGVFFLILIIALLYFGATMLMGKFSTP